MSIAKNEITKPLQFWNETLLILTFLSVRGIEYKTSSVIVAYLAVFLFVIILGKALVSLGMLSYVTRLNNGQNPELLDIQTTVKRLETKIDSIINNES